MMQLFCVDFETTLLCGRNHSRGNGAQTTSASGVYKNGSSLYLSAHGDRRGLYLLWQEPSLALMVRVAVLSVAVGQERVPLGSWSLFFASIHDRTTVDTVLHTFLDERFRM